VILLYLPLLRLDCYSVCVGALISGLVGRYGSLRLGIWVWMFRLALLGFGIHSNYPKVCRFRCHWPESITCHHEWSNSDTDFYSHSSHSDRGPLTEAMLTAATLIEALLQWPLYQRPLQLSPSDSNFLMAATLTEAPWQHLSDNSQSDRSTLTEALQ